MFYLSYLRSVLRHKWFVFLECAKRGHPWMGFMHDMSKFRPSEFIPYARYFNGPESKPRRDRTGYYKPYGTGDEAFDFAWLLHQKRNKHHWQWWVLPEDDGGIKEIEMPHKHRLEMVCDWRGAGRAYGNNDPQGWYRANWLKMQLHPDTRAWVEDDLGVWNEDD